MDSQKPRTRINDYIRISPVRLIDQNGFNLGSVPLNDAKRKAFEAGLDLVEVSPEARPPVCRIMDYGKFKYEQSQKEKESRKKQKSLQIKEIRLRPVTDDHDIETKCRAASKFLEEGHKVQLKLKYKKRELAHKDLGFDIVEKFLEHLKDTCNPGKPSMQGQFLICTLEPK